MQLVKVAAAALNQTPLAWEQNLRNIEASLADARAQGASLVCLPGTLAVPNDESMSTTNTRLSSAPTRC